jgi:hypothetical protein
MTIPQESEYSSWIKTIGRWSPRAQSDLLSRLRRANLIETAKSFSEYREIITSKSGWGAIPATSQSSVLQAAKIYIDWKSSRQN